MAAAAALARATALVSGGALFARMGGSALPPRVSANILHELDRLFHLLLDEAAGGPARPARRHTGNKLAGAGGRAVDGERLRALFRSAACLRHCAGVARRADRRGGATMTLGWGGPVGSARVVALGAAIHPTPAELAEVAAFYDRLAAPFTP